MLDYATVDTMAQRLARTCTDRFSLAATTDGTQLNALATLYLMTGRDSLGKAAIDRWVAEPSLTPAARARALSEGISAFIAGTGENPAHAAVIREYTHQLDQLAPQFPRERFQAHLWVLNGVLTDSTTERILPAADTTFHLIETMSSADRRTLGVSLVRPYESLIMMYTNLGQIDAAKRVLAMADRDLAEVPAALAVLAPFRNRIAMIGTRAPLLDAPYWLNTRPPQGHLAVDGRVSVIEFSAHWCGPCRASYPTMAGWQKTLGSRGVQLVLATQTYGYFGAKRNISAHEEIADDSAYFVGTHDFQFPIAVESHSARPSQDTSAVRPVATNSRRYQVTGIPTFFVVDQRGIIRLVVVGWRPQYQRTIQVAVEQLLGKSST